MNLRNSKSLTRSSPSKMKERDLSLESRLQERMRSPKVKEPLLHLQTSPRGIKLPISSPTQHTNLKRVLRSHCRNRLSQPKRSVGARHPTKSQSRDENLFQASTKIDTTGDRLQECVICAEKKGKYVV